MNALKLMEGEEKEEEGPTDVREGLWLCQPGPSPLFPLSCLPLIPCHLSLPLICLFFYVSFSIFAYCDSGGKSLDQERHTKYTQ